MACLHIFLRKIGFKKIAISRLPDFESAFAMTVHKSQGSEYREVWLLPPSVPATTESEEEARGWIRLCFTQPLPVHVNDLCFGEMRRNYVRLWDAIKRRTALADALEWQFEQTDEQASV